MSPPNTNEYEFQNRNSVNIPTSLQSTHSSEQLVSESLAPPNPQRDRHHQQPPKSAHSQGQANKKCLNTIASTYAIDENDSFQFGFSNLRNIESDSQSSKFIKSKSKKQKLRDYLDIKGVKCNNPSSKGNYDACYLVNDQFGSESLKKNVPVQINSVKIKSKGDSGNNSSNSSSTTKSNDKREKSSPTR